MIQKSDELIDAVGFSEHIRAGEKRMAQASLNLIGMNTKLGYERKRILKNAFNLVKTPEPV